MLLNKLGVNQPTELTCVAFVCFIFPSVADIKAQHHNKVSLMDASCAEGDYEEALPKSQSSTTAGKNLPGLCAPAFSVHFQGCVCLLKTVTSVFLI